MRFKPAKQRGVAAIELGLLIAVLLVPLTFGVTELGRAVFQYNILVKATRNADRYLSTQGAGDLANLTIARCLAVYGNRTCSGNALIPNLTTAMVSVTYVSSYPIADPAAPITVNPLNPTGVLNLVTVSISGYPFTSLVPFVVPSLNFGEISTTMRQVL